MGMKAGILLDRDGTIIVDYRYVGNVNRVQFIEGAPEAIARFNRAGIPVALVTNQSGIARGFYGTEDFWEVQEYIARQLAAQGAHIDFLAFSPDHPEGVVEFYRSESPDHKPNPGMAIKAAAELDLDLSRSWVVGDRPEDVALARNVGARSVVLTEEAGDGYAEYFPSLAAAASFLIGEITGEPEPTTFPNSRFDNPSFFIDEYREELVTAFRSIEPQAFKSAALTVQAAYRDGRMVFAAGNGGGASVANHLQCDHLKGIRTATDLRPKSHSLSSSVEVMTALANDVGYDAIFSWQLETFASPGDVFIAFSVSGRSANILRALQWAKENGLHTIAVTGFDGGEAAKLAGISINVKSYNYGIVEDIQASMMHAIAQWIRQAEMTPDAIRSARF